MSEPMEKTIIVSTDGQAIIRSHDDGQSWYRISIDQDLEYDDRVRCLLNDPRDPKALFAGAERGLFHSKDCGVNWERIDCALNDYALWKLAAAERNPDVMYAGTGSPTRAIFFRSQDGGRTWERTSLEMPAKCAGVSRPRMLAMAIDPDDARDVWVGVEEGGLFRTRDGGDTWRRIDTDWPEAPGSSDVHSILVLPGNPNVVLVLVVNALYRSTDGGETWTRSGAKDSWGLRYSRFIARIDGSDTGLLLGIGDGTPGTTGALLRSHDAGASWQQVDMPVQPNSCFWAAGGNPADPDFLLIGTKFGDLFSSSDGGKSWQKEWREFNEITDMTWLPAVPANQGLPHVHA